MDPLALRTQMALKKDNQRQIWCICECLCSDTVFVKTSVISRPNGHVQKIFKIITFLYWSGLASSSICKNSTYIMRIAIICWQKTLWTSQFFLLWDLYSANNRNISLCNMHSAFQFNASIHGLYISGFYIPIRPNFPIQIWNFGSKNSNLQVWTSENKNILRDFVKER